MIEPRILPYTYWCVNAPDDNGSVKLNMNEHRILELAKIGARTNLDDKIKESWKYPDDEQYQENKRQAFEEYVEVCELLRECEDDG